MIRLLAFIYMWQARITIYRVAVRMIIAKAGHVRYRGYLRRLEREHSKMVRNRRIFRTGKPL